MLATYAALDPRVQFLGYTMKVFAKVCENWQSGFVTRVLRLSIQWSTILLGCFQRSTNSVFASDLPPHTSGSNRTNTASKWKLYKDSSALRPVHKQNQKKKKNIKVQLYKRWYVYNDAQYTNKRISTCMFSNIHELILLMSALEFGNGFYNKCRVFFPKKIRNLTESITRVC